MKLSQGPVLITGASGLIGSALSDHLQATYPSLVVHHLTRNKIKKSRWHTVHLERMDRVRSLLETIRPKIVFHCAGSTDSSQEESLFRDNVFATYQL
jgi:nucleoside-diphosphate-sugar epimerase